MSHSYQHAQLHVTATTTLASIVEEFKVTLCSVGMTRKDFKEHPCVKAMSLLLPFSSVRRQALRKTTCGTGRVRTAQEQAISKYMWNSASRGVEKMEPPG